MRWLELDSPFMQALNKVADLLWLNVLTLVCCIPVVTAGASLTAMHYTVLKIVRDEECYIARDFFKSFRRNFRQATIIWLCMLLAVTILASDFYVMQNFEIRFKFAIRIVLIVLALLLVFASQLVFPVLAKFENSVIRTIKNAFFVSILILPRTVLMILVSLLPAVLFFLVPQIIPIVMMFGFTAPAWVAAKLYSKTFRVLEEQVLRGQGDAEEPEEDDEQIFRDRPDESLAEDA